MTSGGLPVEISTLAALCTLILCIVKLTAVITSMKTVVEQYVLVKLEELSKDIAELQTREYENAVRNSQGWGSVRGSEQRNRGRKGSA